MHPFLPVNESPYIDPFLWVRRGLLPADWPLRSAYRTRVMPVIEPGLRTCFEMVTSELSVKGQHVHLSTAKAKAGNCNWCLTKQATCLIRADYLFHALCGDCFRRDKDVFEPLRKVVKLEDIPTPETLKLPAEEVTGSIVTGCIPDQKTFELRQPVAAEWTSPISAKQRAAEEHAAVQPEKGKTYPLADEQETDQTPLRDRDPDSVFPLDLNCPGYTQEILEALSNDTLHSVWSSWGIPEAKWPVSIKELLKKHVPGSGYAWETRLLRHLGEMPTELICRWVKALKSSMTRAELRAYVKRRPDFTADMLP